MQQLTTFSQNREDLYLYALLGHVDKGFFVDVGAYHPTLHSVTKLFSDLGWGGMNIEANPRLFTLFEAERGDEINVCSAISDVGGTVRFRDYPNHDGLSTLSTGVQSIHAASSLPFVDIEVPAITLEDLFALHDVKSIDFLKVDVEGHEVEVLESNDWTRWRPTVVVFEANRGQDAIDCVAKHEYRLEFFDGLNHYMVANEARDVSILNFAGRILHPGYVTRREQDLMKSLQDPSSESAPLSIQSNAPVQLGIRGSALQLKNALGKRAKIANRGHDATSALRVAASRGKAVLRTGKGVVSPNLRSVAPALRVVGADSSRYSERVQTALASQAAAVNDFFGGWHPEDLALFEAWRSDLSGQLAPIGEILDWLGCKTAASHHSWLSLPEDSGVVIADIPVPDDQVHAEAIEYFGLITSLTEASKTSFCVVELGASYAPWSVAACLVASRLDFETVQGIAVEANASTLVSIREHIERNQLPSKGVQFQVMHGAVSTTSDPVYFPTVDTSVDNGAQVTKSPAASDYRGVQQQYTEVPGLTLAQVTAGIDRIDFLHMDLQGAEEELLMNGEFMSVLTAKVGVLMLATQSRLIEGIALRELTRRGWQLLRERPTTFNPNERTRDVNGWTLRDGAQVWRNSLVVES